MCPSFTWKTRQYLLNSNCLRVEDNKIYIWIYSWTSQPILLYSNTVNSQWKGLSSRKFCFVFSSFSSFFYVYEVLFFVINPKQVQKLVFYKFTLLTTTFVPFCSYQYTKFHFSCLRKKGWFSQPPCLSFSFDIISTWTGRKSKGRRGKEENNISLYIAEDTPLSQLK